MPKQLVLFLDGTGDSPEADGQWEAANNIQIGRDLVGDGLQGTRNIHRNAKEGWDIDEWDLPDGGKRTVFYLRGLGAPKFDANRKAKPSLWNPPNIFKDVEGVYGKFCDAKSQLFASGIIEKVALAYEFLVAHYKPGDQVYLFGFSRGAYTARLLVSLLWHVGLIDKNKIGTSQYGDLIEQAFMSYERNLDADAENNPARNFREQYSLPRTNDLVTYLGLFDCVPGMVDEQVNEDRNLPGNVGVGRHAMAGEERRAPYRVKLWIADRKLRNSEQRWFAGDHSDCGGGYTDDHSLANNTLQWIYQEAIKAGLTINPQALQRYPGNPLGMQHNSIKEEVEPGTGLYWDKLFDPIYRRVLETSPDEILSPELFNRFKQNVQIKDANVVRTIRYLPSSMAHVLTAHENITHSLAAFDEFKRSSADMSRDYAYSDLGDVDSAYTPGDQTVDTRDNNVITASNLRRWCPTFC